LEINYFNDITPIENERISIRKNHVKKGRLYLDKTREISKEIYYVPSTYQDFWRDDKATLTKDVNDMCHPSYSDNKKSVSIITSRRQEKNATSHGVLSLIKIEKV